MKWKSSPVDERHQELLAQLDAAEPTWQVSLLRYLVHRAYRTCLRRQDLLRCAAAQPWLVGLKKQAAQ